jgi:threonine synthase
VVVISTAHGLKFTGFKSDYHEGRLADAVSRYRNTPVELPAQVAAVKAQLEQWLFH